MAVQKTPETAKLESRLERLREARNVFNRYGCFRPQMKNFIINKGKKLMNGRNKNNQGINHIISMKYMLSAVLRLFSHGNQLRSQFLVFWCGLAAGGAETPPEPCSTMETVNKQSGTSGVSHKGEHSFCRLISWKQDILVATLVGEHVNGYLRQRPRNDVFDNAARVRPKLSDRH